MSNTLILLGLLLNENLLRCIYMNWITFEKESSAFVFCVYKNWCFVFFFSSLSTKNLHVPCYISEN